MNFDVFTWFGAWVEGLKKVWWGRLFIVLTSPLWLTILIVIGLLVFLTKLTLVILSPLIWIVTGKVYDPEQY